jgi:hypothetical protein
MKFLADLVRYSTPTWTDKDRYKWLSTIHSWLVPACLFLFIFLSNPLLRFLILCIQLITIITEFFFKECLITMVEKEFSEETWDDIANKIFKANGWELTRPEKMSFNIGINVGVFLVFILILLRESLLWMIGLAGLSMATIPSLWLFNSLQSQQDILNYKA